MTITIGQGPIMIVHQVATAGGRKCGCDSPESDTLVQMLPFDQMPEDNARLADIEIHFPRLLDDSAESCPVPKSEILEYLSMEAPDALKEENLHFLRTAQVGEKEYWIWDFHDADGARCYVTVSLDPDRQAMIGYEVDYYNLSPEQFMLGDYHQVF